MSRPDLNPANEAPAAEVVEREPANAQALGSATVAEVESELQQALAKANENYDLFVRAKAETENVRRRGQEDVAKAYKFAIESFAEALLP